MSCNYRNLGFCANHKVGAGWACNDKHDKNSNEHFDFINHENFQHKKEKLYGAPNSPGPTSSYCRLPIESWITDFTDGGKCYSELKDYTTPLPTDGGGYKVSNGNGATAVGQSDEGKSRILQNNLLKFQEGSILIVKVDMSGVSNFVNNANFYSTFPTGQGAAADCPVACMTAEDAEGCTIKGFGYADGAYGGGCTIGEFGRCSGDDREYSNALEIDWFESNSNNGLIQTTFHTVIGSWGQAAYQWNLNNHVPNWASSPFYIGYELKKSGLSIYCSGTLNNLITNNNMVEATCSYTKNTDVCNTGDTYRTLLWPDSISEPLFSDSGWTLYQGLNPEFIPDYEPADKKSGATFTVSDYMTNNIEVLNGDNQVMACCPGSTPTSPPGPTGCSGGGCCTSMTDKSDCSTCGANECVHGGWATEDNCTGNNVWCP